MAAALLLGVGIYLSLFKNRKPTIPDPGPPPPPPAVVDEVPVIPPVLPLFVPGSNNKLLGKQIPVCFKLLQAFKADPAPKEEVVLGPLFGDGDQDDNSSPSRVDLDLSKERTTRNIVETYINPSQPLRKNRGGNGNRRIPTGPHYRPAPKNSGNQPSSSSTSQNPQPKASPQPQPKKGVTITPVISVIPVSEPKPKKPKGKQPAILPSSKSRVSSGPNFNTQFSSISEVIKNKKRPV